jgi:GGDEF domain-containing protein
MELGPLEIQIFLGLLVVLGTAFVALICDFLKGNNEQLRERNIELRARQEERERLGVPSLSWLQSLATLVQNPHLVERLAPAGSAVGVAVGDPMNGQGVEAADDVLPSEEGPVGRPGEADQEFFAASETEGTSQAEPEVSDRQSRLRRGPHQDAKTQARVPAWASKEELELLAGRAARIRARQGTAQRQEEDKVGETSPEIVPEKEPDPGPRQVSSEPRGVAPVEPPKPIAQPKKQESSEINLTNWEAFLASIPKAEPPATEPPASTQASTVAEPKIEPMPGRSTADLGIFAEEEPATAAPAVQDTMEKERQPEPAAVEPLSIWREPPPAEILSGPEASGKVLPISVGPERIEHREEEHDELRQAANSYGEQAASRHHATTNELFLKEEDTLPVSAVQELPVEPAGDVPPSAPLETSSAVPDLSGIGDIRLPTGLQEAGVLNRLLESSAPFSGVVVAIGINDYESVREKLQSGPNSEYLASLNKMVLSMLRPQDFASRLVDDEYILLYPGESGSTAQRRLFQVSEKLWDFQLRSLGHLSVMFSWGGLEVKNETMAEAVASARERMYQTRRNRKPASELSISRKRVVNG